MGKVPAWSLGLFLVLAIPTNAADPSQSPGDAAAPGGRVLELRVVERDGGKPVAGVAICSLLGCNDEPSFRGTTDDQGRCSVPVPRDVEATRYFPVHAWRDGFVPVRVVWGSARQFEFEGVPASYTVLLDRGVPIGGVVRDEQGRPVAGARVFPTFTGRRRDEFEWLDLPRDASFATDDQGRWRCAILPASWEAGEMSFRITHPRFLGSGPTYDRRLPIKDLRAIGRRGVGDRLHPERDGHRPGWPTHRGGVGRLAGPQRRGRLAPREVGRGWPVSIREPPAGDRPDRGRGARPGDGREAGRARSPRHESTGAHAAGGRSTGAHSAGGRAPPHCPEAPRRGWAGGPALLARATPRPPVRPEFFPSDAKQPAKDGPCEPPLVLRLEPGRTVRGRVVNAKGQPIAGARVTPELRGCRDLLGWRAETGPDGRFEWTNAPREFDVLNVEAPAEGHEVRRFVPRVYDWDLVVRMPPPFRLRGTVVDAETGRPIEEFRLIEGDVWTHDFAPEEVESPLDWSAGRARTVAGGRYDVRFPRSGRPGEDRGIWYTLLVIRVEAEGYAPAISRKYRPHEGEQTCDFALHKHPWIKGIVRAPDGSPAAGAEVIIAVKGGPVPGIYNGRLVKGWRGDVVRTGPDGRFAFARPDQGGRVVIVSDRGLAQRTPDELAAAPDVTLEPWGRVRGQLRVGTGVEARRIVGALVTEADYRGQPAVPFNARALTDAEGRFLLDRIPPGHAMVYRLHGSSDGPILRSHRQGLDVASGQTAEVIMGGAGRPVVGRVTRSAGLPSFDLESARGQLKLQQPAPEFPEGFDEWEPARQRAWWFAFYETEEGRKYCERANGYVVAVRPDGSFRVDDVPEGRYRLKLEYEESPAWPDSPDATNARVKVAVLEMYFDVPPGPDEQPLDFGTLTLTPPEPEVIDR